jgi:hypothetical protein
MKINKEKCDQCGVEKNTNPIFRTGGMPLHVGLNRKAIEGDVEVAHLQTVEEVKKSMATHTDYFDFCSEECLRAFLNHRAEALAK